MSKYARFKAAEEIQNKMHQERRDRVRKQKIYDEEGEVCVERLVKIRDRSQRNLNISTPLSSSSQYGYQTKCESTTNLS